MALGKTLRGVNRAGKIFLTTLLAAAAINLAGCEKKSQNTIDGPKGYPPEAPYITTITPIAQEPRRGMLLQIKDMSDNEDGFYLERKKEAPVEEGGGFFYRIEELPQAMPGDVVRHWDNGRGEEGLERSTKYTYRIRAFNEYGKSEWSSEVSQTTYGILNAIIYIGSPVKDADVDERVPNQNSEGTSLLVVGSMERKSQEAYIQFPLDKLPPYALRIKSAELSMIHQGEYGPSDSVLANIGVFKSSRYWNESHITWNNKPSAENMVSWYNYVFNSDNNFSTWDVTSYYQSYSDSTREVFLARLNEGFVLKQDYHIPNKIVGYRSIEGTPSGSRSSVLKLEYEW